MQIKKCKNSKRNSVFVFQLLRCMWISKLVNANRKT